MIAHMLEFRKDLDLLLDLVIDVPLSKDFLLQYLAGHLPSSHNVDCQMDNRVRTALKTVEFK
jgi:hypothetical protein